MTVAELLAGYERREQRLRDERAALRGRLGAEGQLATTWVQSALAAEGVGRELTDPGELAGLGDTLAARIATAGEDAAVGTRDAVSEPVAGYLADLVRLARGEPTAGLAPLPMRFYQLEHQLVNPITWQRLDAVAEPEGSTGLSVYFLDPAGLARVMVEWFARRDGHGAEDAAALGAATERAVAGREVSDPHERRSLAFTLPSEARPVPSPLGFGEVFERLGALVDIAQRVLHPDWDVPEHGGRPAPERVRLVRWDRPMVGPGGERVRYDWARTPDGTLTVWFVDAPAVVAGLAAAWLAPAEFSGAAPAVIGWIAWWTQRAAAAPVRQPHTWLTVADVVEMAELPERDPAGSAGVVRGTDPLEARAAHEEDLFADWPQLRALYRHYRAERRLAAAARLTPIPAPADSRFRNPYRDSNMHRPELAELADRHAWGRPLADSPVEELALLALLRARDLAAEADRRQLADISERQLLTEAHRLSVWGRRGRGYPAGFDATGPLPAVPVGDPDLARRHAGYLTDAFGDELLPVGAGLAELLEHYQLLHRRLRGELDPTRTPAQAMFGLMPPGTVLLSQQPVPPSSPEPKNRDWFAMSMSLHTLEELPQTSGRASRGRVPEPSDFNDEYHTLFDYVRATERDVFVQVERPMLDPATGSVADVLTATFAGHTVYYYSDDAALARGQARARLTGKFYGDPKLPDEQATELAAIAERTTSAATPQDWLSAADARRNLMLAETDPAAWAQLLADPAQAREAALAVFTYHPSWAGLVEHVTHQRHRAAGDRVTPLPVTPAVARKAVRDAEDMLKDLVNQAAPDHRTDLKAARAHHQRRIDGQPLAELIGLRARDLQADALRLGITLDPEQLVVLAARLVVWGGSTRFYPAADNLPTVDLGERVRDALSRVFVAGYLNPELLPEDLTVTTLLERYEQLHQRIRELLTGEANPGGGAR